MKPREVCLCCLNARPMTGWDLCEDCQADQVADRPNPVPLRQWGTREAWETQNMENDYERWMAGDDL